MLCRKILPEFPVRRGDLDVSTPSQFLRLKEQACTLHAPFTSRYQSAKTLKIGRRLKSRISYINICLSATFCKPDIMSNTGSIIQEIEIKNRKSEKTEKELKKCENPMNVKIISVEITGGGDSKLTSRELADILKLMAENKDRS